MYLESRWAHANVKLHFLKNFGAPTPSEELNFVGLTLLERGELFLCKSTFLRRIVILGVLVIEVRGYFI